MKVLVIGPSDKKSRGGMATVIGDIRYDEKLNRKFDIDIFASYIDGNLPVRFFYSAYAFLKFLIRYKDYDLFHLHTAAYGSTYRKYCYLRVIKKAGKKAIVHVHGAKYLVFYENLSEKRKKMVARFLNEADMVLALSESWKERLDSIFGLKNCKVLENGIDTGLYVSANTENAETLHSFAVLGRLGQRKGTYDLLNAIELAVKSVPDLMCYLAGDGETEKIKDIIRMKKLDKNVVVTGWIGREEKLELLKKVSTIVLPSYNEGLPMSILEGMAAGKAVISTNVGAIPEVVGKENGILIDPGDVEALSEALIRCCENTEMVKRMSAENEEKICRQFSLERMHGKLAEYYEECLGI